VPVESDILNANIAEPFRDPEGRWYGLSVRARTVVYNPDNVTEEELASLNEYRDLADPIWRGRLCMRPASHIYTISLFSSLLYHLGQEEAAAVTEGIVANVGRYINSDTSMIQATAAGECDVVVVNHYYMGRLANGSEADRAVFNSVRLKWMNQDSDGVFFNINGGGIVKNAANYDNALRFLEFMSQTENQCGESACFPGSNYEFPTNPNAEVNETIAAFGEFKLDLAYPLWEYGQYQAAAVSMLEAAGFGFRES
jgi:iron(III) transport system substrate-binding protein